VSSPESSLVAVTIATHSDSPVNYATGVPVVTTDAGRQNFRENR